mmetsp:Transcript_35235/g.51762  ORF Transcript_35235/g.51762 Transcript_35235/m.51762 type:complete len:234 (+) Transcript_35235:107-808(+)|eukprot:CAMPEP_0195521236 /NCGR_PEP_ID=MMETSP0794_2-20130614/18270_1 /TAXON_ID=515487 /ORGANISM="Stephanopyxis turris, Strain CCMP 815" /LENGTH=233 /DNA_ID=CAMNT_0040650745 /DNA_START=107 /DNA_END=808 /DNA_ORIENTATION=-
MRLVALSAAAVLCAIGAASAQTEFGCAKGDSIYSCICGNPSFTSQLCTYLDQAVSNSSSDDSVAYNSYYSQIESSSTAYTVFAVNNSAYASLTAAETSAYTSVLQDCLEYQAVNQTFATLADLQAKSSFSLPTIAGSTKLLLVTSANNQTVLNDDDTCTVSTCSPAGKGAVCLVSCVLTPSEGLGTIAIIGIVVAGIAALCLIVACLFNIFHKDQEPDDDNAASDYQTVEDGE